MRPGETAFDRFEIEEEAGAGGMGAIYRARDARTGERVALKIMQGMDERDALRFEREATLLSEIAHPGIVRYVAHGPSWIAMEWLDGEDLEQRLERAPLTVTESVALARAVADALGAAHARGVVHRDVKPANLWLVGGVPANVKLLDFGIARAAVNVTLTAVGTIVGTPAYMAPEQARGEREIDARADVFSLGCVLFECLANRPAFVGSSIPALLAKVLLEDVPRLGEIVSISSELEALVGVMLSKDPEQRPADGHAVAKALQDLGAGSRAAEPSASVGLGEQRLAAVVLIEREVDLAATLESSAAIPSRDLVEVVVGGSMEAYRRVAAEHSARAEPLADGSVVVSMSTGGTPTDRARRAAACALALAGVAKNARVALAVGRTLDAGGRPLGEALDRAANLLRTARARSGVRVDASTSALLDTRFEIETDADDLLLVGVRDRREPNVVRMLLGKPTPFVGRAGNLAMLDGWLERGVETPEATTILVTAPAGVGKTRLAHELLEQHREDEMQVWIGRGDPTSAGAPFGLCAQMIRAQANIRAGEPLDVRRDKLRARVGRRLRGPDASRVSEFLGEMIGTPFPDNARLEGARRDAIVMGDQIARAWVDLVEAECSVGPLLLFFDDLHWGDVGTVTLIDLALHVCQEKALVTLALARPEVERHFPKLFASRNPMVLRLGPLSLKGSEKLVRAVLGAEAAPELVTRIAEQADGNAFSLEELIRAAAEGHTASVPESVLGMVEARLAALDVEARRYLRAASVLGQTFWAGAVAALVGLDPGSKQVGGLLDVLERGEWIAPRIESSVENESEFRFRHALVRDAAYAMLTDQDRRAGHALAGAWLEQRAAADASTLADHFEKGGDLAHAGELFARAARHALETSGFDEALARAERGLACGASGELRARLCAVQSEAHKWRGEPEPALERATEAFASFEEGSPAWASAAAEIAGLALKRGEKAKVVEVAEALLRASVAAGASAAILPETARVVISTRLAGEDDLARKLLHAAEARADESAAPLLHAWIARARALLARLAGDPAAFLDNLARAAAAFDDAGVPRQACNARGDGGFACIECGQFAQAEVVLRAALAEAERMNLVYVVATAKQNLAYALFHLGRAEEARAMEAGAIESFHAEGDVRMEAASRVYLSEMLMHESPERAEQEALAAARLLGDASPLLRPFVLTAHAKILVLRPERTAEALEVTLEAMKAFEAAGGRAETGEADLLLVHAEVLERTGDRDGAHRAIARARDRLLERARKIDNERWRKSFLENVPAHARTLAIAAAWLGDKRSSGD